MVSRPTGMSATTKPDSHLRGGEVAAIARTLAGAFQDDPVFSWCLPDPMRRAGILPGFFGVLTAAVHPLGEVHTTADGTAAALWVPPGRVAVADDDAPAFQAALAEILGDDADRTFAVSAMLDEVHPTDEHRFLWFLGVSPEHQRRGRGSSLLASMLARCDREGSAAYLDATSPHNRRLYERHGFEVVAERAVDDSPPLWSMWRQPR